MTEKLSVGASDYFTIVDGDAGSTNKNKKVLASALSSGVEKKTLAGTPTYLVGKYDVKNGVVLTTENLFSLAIETNEKSLYWYDTNSTAETEPRPSEEPVLSVIIDKGKASIKGCLSQYTTDYYINLHRHTSGTSLASVLRASGAGAGRLVVGQYYTMCAYGEPQGAMSLYLPVRGESVTNASISVTKTGNFYNVNNPMYPTLQFYDIGLRLTPNVVYDCDVYLGVFELAGIGVAPYSANVGTESNFEIVSGTINGNGRYCYDATSLNKISNGTADAIASDIAESEKTVQVLYTRNQTNEQFYVWTPTKNGLTRWEIIHNVYNDYITATSHFRHCNCWRLGEIYNCDKNTVTLRECYNYSGEIESAVRLKDTELTTYPDYISGYAHGNEIFDKIRIYVDGAPWGTGTFDASDDYSLLSTYGTKRFNCKEFKVVVGSTLYTVQTEPTSPVPPVVPTTDPVAYHGKEMIFTNEGLLLNQSLKFLKNNTLTTTMMNMLNVNYRDDNNVYFPVYTDSTEFKEYEFANVSSILTRTDFPQSAEYYNQNRERVIHWQLLSAPKTDTRFFYVYYGTGAPYRRKLYPVVCGGYSFSGSCDVVEGEIWQTSAKMNFGLGC